MQFNFYRREADRKIKQKIVTTESNVIQHTILKQFWFLSINHFQQTAPFSNSFRDNFLRNKNVPHHQGVVRYFL